MSTWHKLLFIYFNAHLVFAAKLITEKLSKSQKFVYPPARKSNSTEIFHNKYVVDNKYDWMENPDSIETTNFTKAQNKVTYII